MSAIITHDRQHVLRRFCKAWKIKAVQIGAFSAEPNGSETITNGMESFARFIVELIRDILTVARFEIH